MVNDSLAKIYQLIVPMTPIKSGDLRRGYRIIKAESCLVVVSWEH